MSHLIRIYAFCKFSFFICGVLNLKKMPETKIADFAKSIDPDEAVHNEPPHLDLHCLPSSLCLMMNHTVWA